MSASVGSGYGQHTRAINEGYAERHGYRWIVDDTDHGHGERDTRWNKVGALREALRAMQSTGEEAVMWIDADAAFTNFAAAAHELLDQAAPSEDLLICRDLSVPREKPTCAPICLNTGAFLLRNTEWSRQLVEHWWGALRDHPALAFGGDHEEAMLAQLYGTGWSGMRDKTKVFGATAFNSVPPFLADHAPEQLVMHASGEPSAVRSLIFGRIASTLAPSPSDGLPWLDIAPLLPKLHPLVRQGYEAAHAKNPDDPKVASVLASLVSESKEEGSAARARELLRQAMRLSPTDANLAVTYGSYAAKHMDDWCDAAAAFVAAVRLQPDSETSAQLLRGANQKCAE
eukprot:CAMPEP_0173396756 /NCGR_PEP_ID=MMETSP1356-20130122/36467_1 /TAXON_ID=77927 ORGANISM="Hemiselmis virescens, Strain PCC157" /NCGR_SAMPLE_ID=MMETSP1356 /ASSEMBLY_ACC=CAM_ASM_000847 /LENGTH=342 /DNA_ID=CAMNT_0014355857 /DNA_START=41 /DNA_END=1066 /DNA_ORIENTATION=+